jgi:hypothetical protein
MLRHGIFLLPILALAACHSPGPTDFVSPRPIASTPGSVPADASPAPAPVSLPKNAKIHLKFAIQPTLSTGNIRTVLDPEGPALGPRSSECRTPLRGSISAKLTTDSVGTRSLRFEEIDLQTTSEGRLLYNWSPLIGTISTTLPPGVLRISDHHIPGACPLAPDGSFHRPGHQFTVDCAGEIEGRGLILGKAVGKFRSPLDIPVTDLVTVSGSLTRQDNEFVLHIPAAVLRDRFDLDGAALDLVFTGDITATAPAQ